MLFFLSAIDSFEERNEEELGSEKKALPQRGRFQYLSYLNRAVSKLC